MTAEKLRLDIAILLPGTLDAADAFRDALDIRDPSL